MADDVEFIRITNRDIWNGLNEVKTKLGELEVQVSGAGEERIVMRQRVRSLELKFYGILAGLLGGITMFGAILLKGGPGG